MPKFSVSEFRRELSEVLATSDKIRNANSLAFVGGVPLYERYFLGSEFDLRGYNARSIGPIAPFDGFVTTRNVVVGNQRRRNADRRLRVLTRAI